MSQYAITRTYTSASDHYFDLTGEQVTPSTNYTE